jgi:tetratricopeptide (TPR) repeat protein
MKMANAAESTFKDVLKDNPRDTTAIAYLGSLYLNEKRWDESKAWYDKLTTVDPKSAVGFYSKGFIAWSEWYPADGTARANLGMKLEDPGPIKDKKVREELKAKYSGIIDEGLKNLDMALQVDPDYDDAMAYENLLIRERADLADNKEEYDQQIKIADNWIDKAMAVKKKKNEAKQKTSGGIVAEQK